MVWLILIGLGLLFGGVYAWTQGKHRLAWGLMLTPLTVVLIFIVFDRLESWRAADLIAPDQLQLSGLQMTASNSRAWSLRARLQNNATDYVLKEIVLRVRALDCVADQPQSECIAIGEAVERMEIEVPPGQARDLQYRVAMVNPVLPKGELHWKTEIVSTRAE